MEEAAGEAPEPHHEEGGDGSNASPGGPLVVVGILLLVGIVGLVAWMTRGDDVVQTVEQAEERFPDDTSTTVSSIPGGGPVPTTATAETVAPTAPATASPTEPPTAPPTLPPTTAAPAAAPTTAPAAPTTVASASSDPTSTVAAGPSIAELVPSVAAIPTPLTTPDAVRLQIDQLLVNPRHDVAGPGDVAALCAVVPLDGPIVVAGRWERDGQRVSSTDPVGRTAPGFGECVGNDGDVLETGSYQFIATDTDGDESAPGGFVVGAERIDQRFSNNGSDPICGVRIAPSTSRYFEAYVFDAEPVPPGAVFTLPVAVVEQDVETMSCRKGEVLSTFDFLPDAGEVQQLRP